MMISTICIIAAMAMNMLLAASNYRTIRGYIIFDRIDIQYPVEITGRYSEIQTMPSLLPKWARTALSFK